MRSMRYVDTWADRQAQIERCVHGSIHICMNAYNVAYVFASIVSM